MRFETHRVFVLSKIYPKGMVLFNETDFAKVDRGYPLQ